MSIDQIHPNQKLNVHSGYYAGAIARVVRVTADRVVVNVDDRIVYWLAGGLPLLTVAKAAR